MTDADMGAGRAEEAQIEAVEVGAARILKNVVRSDSYYTYY